MSDGSEKVEAILIGGSAGSYDTIAGLLSVMDGSVMPPVIVVLHRMRNVDSNIIELLKNRTGQGNIVEADEKQAILPGMVYIAPANYHLLVEEDKTFCLDSSAPVRYCRPSIDVTFESASLVYGPKMAGILLSGSNEDGSYGMKCIEQRGGMAIIQDPDGTPFKTMLLSCIRMLSQPRIYSLTEIRKYLTSRSI
jgi:two-component system chemotaxis response regulator CheB